MKIALNYQSIILNTYQNANIVVHIMGELCFCFALLQLHQKQEDTCVETTSKPNVEQKENVKTTIIEFCRFREYPQI